MKNNRSKIRAFKWKHLLGAYHFSMKYMLKHNRRRNKKRASRFKPDVFRQRVNSMLAERAAYDLFRGTGAHSNKGVYIEFPHVKISITMPYLPK